jgi:hypothetical protein
MTMSRISVAVGLTHIVFVRQAIEPTMSYDAGRYTLLVNLAAVRKSNAGSRCRAAKRIIWFILD